MTSNMELFHLYFKGKERAKVKKEAQWDWAFPKITQLFGTTTYAM